MRKQILALLAISSLMLAISGPVSADTGSEMEVLARGLKVVKQSDNAADIKTALTEMRAAAQSAQQQTPPKLEGRAGDSAELKDYRHVYDQLIAKIDDALKLVDEGKIKEAKGVATELAATRDAGHRKYR